jgi:hypothetical protein
MNAFTKLAVLLLLPLWLSGQTSVPGAPAVLTIRVVQDNGPVHVVGSRGASVLTVEVIDDVGKPVENAAVSFRLPASGPGGVFSNGLTTEVVITGCDGRAALGGVRFNRTAGPFDIRVTAVKGQVRAGTAIPRQLSTPEGAKTAAQDAYHAPRKRLKLIVLVAGVAAGSVVASLAYSRRSGSAASTGDSLSVGMPTVTIGAPQ